MTQRTVVVTSATGPTGGWEKVNIYANFTGRTGAFEQCLQATGANKGPTGLLQRVSPIAGPTAGIRNIIIRGYVGPTGS